MFTRRLVEAIVMACVSAAALPQAMPPGGPDDWASNPSQWRQVGVAMMAKAPAYVRSGSDYDKLRYLYLQYCDLLSKNNIPLNGTLGTRATVSLTKWTCGNHTLNLENLFNGSGVATLQLAMLRGAPDSWISYILKGVNCDHGAVAAAVDGVMFVFDPWLPAYLSKRSYTNAMQADYGGIPYPLWEMVMRSHGYNSFQAGHEVWQPTLKKALEAALLPSSSTPSVPKPIRSLSQGHWRLVAIDLMPYNATDPTTALGAIYGHSWFWWYPQEPDKDHLSRARVAVAMSPHAAVLIPNTKLAVAASMFEAFDSPQKCGVTSCEIKWSHDAADGSRKTVSDFDPTRMMGRIDKENQVWRQSTSFDIPIPVGSPGEAFRIFMVAPPGSIRYTYGWSATGTPKPEGAAAMSFARRWQTSWGVVELRVRGKEVDGTYAHDGGKIRGTISTDGRTLKGTWSESPTYRAPNDAGDFVFELDEGGKSFKGRYWYGTRKPGDAGTSWDGTRIG